MAAATRLGAQLDGLGSAAVPATDLEQLQREAAELITRATGVFALVQSGLVMLEQAGGEAVSRASAFQLVSAGVLGLDAGPLLACLLLRVGWPEQADSMAKLFLLLMATFAEVGRQFAARQPSDAAGAVRAAFSAVVREPLLVSLMDRSRHYMELARERGRSSASLVQMGAGGLADGVLYLLQALPAGPGAGWTAFQQLLDVEALRQSFMPRLSAAASVVRMGGGPGPPGCLLPLLHITAAAVRHAAASGLAGAEHPVEDALGVVTFFLGADLALEPPTVQQGLQLAIQAVGSAAAAVGRAAGLADGCGVGSSAETGDGRSTSPGLGGVLRALCGALAQLGAKCMNSVGASEETRRESARQQAWDAAWLGQSIAEMCAAAEACERLAIALVLALADGRVLAGGLGGAGARRLARALAVHSDSLVTGINVVAKQQLGLAGSWQLRREDRRALLWLSRTSAKAVHAALAHLRLFDPEETSSSLFSACQAALFLAYLALDRQPTPAAEQR